ncbi:MAG TPA: 50S ribosomal protein L11 methyltransferase [Pyrinomonadaceae bacterium]|nr:50S ribosomal protein L11 methyltransferase [Pyrinomonadaceae bacterium]
MSMVWHELEIDLEPAAREAVEYALMEAGALGTVTADEADKVTGYFADVPDRELIRSELLEALRIYQMPSSSVRDMNLREVEDRDWLAEWKKSWQPVQVGRFVIAPPWTEINDAPDRIVIRIEPGMAFGTGTHETTRLCLDAIDKHFAGGSFLDVGTGTGILAIAAAKMFPGARIDACDTDPHAIEIARDNARANGVGDQIEFRVGSVEETTPSADLVCANLTADVILQIMPALISVTCGKLILCGILETQIEQILGVLHDEVEITQDGEWVAIVV